MKVSIVRPYFAPYPGYFYRMLRSDLVVVLDMVQFPRRTTWITRNRFKNDQGVLWMTVPVRKRGLGLQKINSVRINPEGPWARKHPAALKAAYAHAPYLENHLPFVEGLWGGAYEGILDLNLAIIRHLMQALNIQRKIVLQSELGTQAKGDLLLVEICRATGADVYLAQRDVQKYIDADLFRNAGVQLEFLVPPVPVYPQLWGDFIYNLSTFDLVFNCGPKAGEILQRQ